MWELYYIYFMHITKFRYIIKVGKYSVLLSNQDKTRDFGRVHWPYVLWYKSKLFVVAREAILEIGISKNNCANLDHKYERLLECKQMVARKLIIEIGISKIIVLIWIKNMKDYWNGNKAIPWHVSGTGMCSKVLARVHTCVDKY